MEPRITRRATLLAALALGGCSLEPLRFVDEEPPAPPTEQPTRVVDPQFMERALDGGVKTLHEGPISELRIATPHVDAVLRGFYVGQVLTTETALQVGIPETIAAPEGYELLAFVLQANVPAYGRTPDRSESCSLRVGGRSIPLEALFDDFIDGVGWMREWEFIALCVPEGEDVMLAIEDQGREVQVDLRTGAPVEDEGWAANYGFRNRQRVVFEPSTGVFQREFETRPPEGFEADRGRMVIQFRPYPEQPTVPWIPTLEWAPEGQQWLVLPMMPLVSYETVPPKLAIDVPASFTYRDQLGRSVGAAEPASVQFDELLRGQADLTPVWPIPADQESGTISIEIQGTLTVDYVEAADVPADFLDEAQPLEFECSFSSADG